MLKAQNKENEQQQQITKKMNASEVKEYKEDEDEDEDKSNNPLCENRELSGWFFKKGELLNRWNERYVSVDEKIRTLSFYSSSSSLSSSKPTSIVSFDALEKFSSRKGGEKGEEDAIIIRVQLQNGKDLFLKRNNNHHQQQQQQQKKKKKSYLFKEGGEEEWCAKMNALLNLLPTPECRQKRGGGISNTTLSALKNSSSGKGGIGKIVLGNANVVARDNQHHHEDDDDGNIHMNTNRGVNTPPSATRRHIEYCDDEEADFEASSTVSSSYYGTSATKNGAGDSQTTNDRVLDTFKAMELALRAKDELLSAQTQLSDRLETQLKEKELEIQRLTKKLNGTKDLEEAFDEANMRAMEMEDQAAMLSVSIDSLTRELDDEREYELNKKLSDVTLKLQKVENEKKHQKDVYETTERELTLSRDRLLAEIARERRNRGMFSPEQQQHQQHQRRRAMKQQPRGGALANGSISNNVEDQNSINNNISDQLNATKDESPIRQISFASHTPLNQSIASRDDEDDDEGERANNAFYRRADKNLSKLLTPEEHSCRVQ
ncbi:unnamed protein product [Bathycoccus prasinos]